MTEPDDQRSRRAVPPASLTERSPSGYIPAVAFPAGIRRDQMTEPINSFLAGWTAAGRDGDTGARQGHPIPGAGHRPAGEGGAA